MDFKNRSRPITKKCHYSGQTELTRHEKEELYQDFNIDIYGYDIIIALTKREFEVLLKVKENP